MGFTSEAYPSRNMPWTNNNRNHPPRKTNSIGYNSSLQSKASDALTDNNFDNFDDDFIDAEIKIKERDDVSNSTDILLSMINRESIAFMANERLIKLQAVIKGYLSRKRYKVKVHHVLSVPKRKNIVTINRGQTIFQCVNKSSQSDHYISNKNDDSDTKTKNIIDIERKYTDIDHDKNKVNDIFNDRLSNDSEEDEHDYIGIHLNILNNSKNLLNDNFIANDENVKTILKQD